MKPQTRCPCWMPAGARHDTLLTDGWDGYLFERDQILDMFKQLGAQGGNPVSLAGCAVLPPR